MSRLVRRPWFLATALAGLLAAGWYGVREWRARAHWAAAQASLEHHDFAAALGHLAACRGAWPNRGEVHLLSARAARRDGAYDEAARHLRRADQCGADAEAVTLERILLAYTRGDLRLEAHLRGLVEAGGPETPAILEVLIDRWLADYHLWDALQGLNRYLAARPDDVPALLGRARVWEGLFYFSDALADYRRAAGLAPDDVAVLRGLAAAELKSGTPAAAAAAYERLLTHQPGDRASLLGLARCQRGLGEREEAKSILSRLADERSGPALVLLGEVAEEEGRDGEAEAWFRQAATALPFDRTAAYHLARCLERLRRPDAAEAAARLARIDADLKRLDELSRAVLREPGNVAHRREAGAILLRSGEEKLGIGWLHGALTLAPADRETHRLLAEHYVRTGQTGRAEEHRRAASGGR